MAKIKLLSPLEIHKIAAGEVIERPANVVKELIENSIDAGALSITLYVEHGGKTLIRVIDNGYGMAAEDARWSIVHHATSKMTHLDDLEQLITFGFRGEALSSIASVSHLTLKTREAESLEGIELTVEEGSILKESLCACPVGTDITIGDLFYNVPARKKFLKTDDTELRVISQLMQAFALCYPSHAFKFYHNQRLVMHCQPTERLKERLSMVYDEQFVRAILPCALEADSSVSVSGVLTNPHYIRYDRNQIFLFVNKRWVKNSKLTHAFLKGYAGALPAGRYPAGVIFINVDPSEVDVNVHPRKEEVHFLHPRRVESALEMMTRATLESYATQNTTAASTAPPETPRSSYSDYVLKGKESTDTSSANRSQPATSFARLDTPQALAFDHKSALQEVAPTQSSQAVEDFQLLVSRALNPLSEKNFEKIIENTQITKQESAFDETSPEETYHILGYFKATYILLENSEGLVLIDQHAAHERVLYELFAQRFAEVAVAPLLFPPFLSFKADEAKLLTSYLTFFEEYGLSIEECPNNQFLVKTAPLLLKNHDLNDLIRHTLACAAEHGEIDKTSFTKTMHHALRAQMACKAAVKAGDVLSNSHMSELIKSLHSVENRFTCPHGRPTSWTLTTYEIERKFKRKV